MTLTDALARAAAEAPGQGVIHADPSGDRFVSYAELYADALRVGGGLHAAGLTPGTTLMIVTDDSADFLALFWGAIVAGIVPVPLPPEPHRLATVRTHLDAAHLAGDTATPGATLLSARDLRSASPLHTPVAVRPDDLAFLQFSSGSTGTPQGVELTHANVLANLAQASRSGQVSSADVFLTWMPYFHDMGLIGTHLTPLHNLCRQIRISPLTFAKRPETWLRTAAQHRATVLAAANFALALTNRRVPEEVLDTLDLSSVRLLMVGAEPISPSVWRTFATRMTRAGLSPGAVQPVYGLAEATVAVASPPMGEVATPVRLHRSALARGVAVPAAFAASPLSSSAGHSASSPVSPVEFMDVGYPVPGCELRIVDDEGLPLEDGLVGHIQLRGPNVTRGYHRSPQATADLFDGSWLRTGDLGFLRSGRLCVTGRHKDVLFVNGRNFHAADLEEVAAATPGLRPGPIAVVGAPDPVSGREQVAVFVAAPAVRPDPSALTALIRSRVAEALSYDQVHIEVVPSGTFTRTTSGKLRRHPFRDRLTTPGPAWPSPESVAATPLISAASAPPTSTLAAPLPVSGSLRSRSAEPDQGRAHPRPVASLSRTETEHIVREIWARVLRIPAETIGPDDRFLAIGGSSLGAMEVLADLEDRFGRTFDPAMLRDCATPAALADRLLTTGAGPHAGPTTAAPMSTGSMPGPDGLAIIGMACRFPGADTPEEFWDNLVAGRDSVTPVTRWAGGGQGAFLADPAQFDAGYFGIAEEEARLLDPHARIFLELAHEALERSGYAGPRRHGRRIGVFAAVGESAYPELMTASSPAGLAGGGGAHALTGTLRNLIAARVAHLLDLHGPALAVDTACSSALVALHLARRSLEAGDCDVAVVGGVNLNLTATGETLLSQAQALSPTGRCRAFAAGADGFVPGEGGAALVLTRLADAGDDRILAVVRGSAVNNDGRSLSLMAPNPLLQQQVIADAYRDSGVDPAEVTYVEAHGTGTAVGDPIEARSLAHAFPPRADGRPRLLGSVKTNIGHLLNVAGLPALVKVILSLHHRRLPPSLHHDRPSPRFDLTAAGFEVVTEHRPWPAPHTAGVNGFGFGGTNAHVILSAPPIAASVDPPVASPPAFAAPEPESASGFSASRAEEEPRLLTLSARSAGALHAAARELADHLRAYPRLRTADVCATVSTARDDGPYRVALVTGNDLPSQLAAVEPGPPMGRPARVAFLFGGQGTQRPGQGTELYRNASVFRATLDEVSAAAGVIAGRTLVDWCTDPAVSMEDLARTEVTQPLVVAFGVALAAQLAAYGIRPAAVTGHSLGELAAAVSAGHLTAVEAVLLAKQRGHLTAELAGPGAMLAVAASTTEVTRLLGESRPPRSGPEIGVEAGPEIVATSWSGVVVAAENSARRVVLAGSREAIDRAEEQLAAAGVVTRRLAVSHAFHSPAMEPVAAHLAHLAPVLRAGTIPLLSTMTGDWLASLDGTYLAAQAVRPVRFAAAVARLQEAGFDAMVEVGAAVTLSHLVRGTNVLCPAPTPADLLAAAGTLWERGVPLDRTHLDSGTRRVEVPTYPFQRSHYWITDPAAPADPGHALLVPAWTEAPPASVSHSAVPRPAAIGEGEPATVVIAGKGGVAAALAAITEVPRNGRLLLVTRDLYATGIGSAHPRHAVWAGLAMAFADENRAAGVRIVDLGSADSKQQRRAAIAHERAAPPAAGPAEIVAWRGGRRLTREFVPAASARGAGSPGSTRDAGGAGSAGSPGGAGSMAAAAGPGGGARSFVLPADGSYLIIGGAGAVGTEIARDLARRGRPQLVLTGRSAEQAALLAELRRSGATAEYVVADVTVPEQVDCLLAGRRFDVVVQAAGVVRPGSLRAKTPDDVTAGLAAKVRGTKLLIRALTARHAADGSVIPLVVALSSVSSVLPGLAGAVGDYVAGNLHLDSLAAAEQSAGHPFVAVNLPALTGGGLAAAHTVAGEGLPIERVPEILWAAVALGVPQVLVNAPARPANHPPSRPMTTPAEELDRPDGGGWGRDSLVAVVREMLAGPLERAPESIGVDEPFLALGLDSLTAVDLVKELETRLGRTLSTTLFFEHRTIAELTSHLAGPGTFPFSPVQRAFVTTGRLYPEVPAYAYVRQTLNGPVDTVRLGWAFAELERRHPMLRVRFGPDGQRFLPADPVISWPAWFSVEEPRRPVEVIDAEVRNRPFDLGREAPVRAVLAGADLIVVVHHAVADGFSLAVLGDELWALYRGAEPGAAPVATFADHEARRSAPVVSDLDHWQRVLDGWPRLALPFDGDAGAEPRGPYAVRQKVLDEGTTRKLTAVARTAEVSVFHVLLAVYARCLARWSGQDAVPVSVARAGRAARVPGVERMVGPFADTLPVLADVRPGESVTALAARLRDRWLAAEQHDSVSTVDLARMLAAAGTGPRTASPAGFSFARFPGTGTTAANVRATTAGTASAATRLGLVCFEAHDTLHFSWNYPEHLFSPATVARLAEDHLAEINALTTAPPAESRPAAQSRPAAEPRPAAAPGSGVESRPAVVVGPGSVGVVERIREQCRRTPDAIAVLSDGWPLTYRELDVRSDRLAVRLAATGERRVGLLTGPGADTVIGLVGILKAGAGWVPMDVSHPPARLASQLERAGAGVVLCDAGSRTAAKAIGLPLIDGDTWRAASEVPLAGDGALPANGEVLVAAGTEVGPGEVAGVPVVRVELDDTAYVIFTSGSTGRPKGVAVTHRSMINYLDWAITTFGYRSGDRLAQTASICFDASVRQILAPLLAGATVVAWDRDTVRDPELLAQRLERDRVTVWSSVPTLWERLLTAAEKTRADLSRLRWVHVGGEELSPAHVRRWFDLLGPGQRITNLYGPTETTINATWHLIDTRPADDAIRLPIGRPIGGATVEVIGPDGQPATDGEIHIGGLGLADGYLDDQEQTAMAFVVRGDKRWYRSGDLAHRDADGLLWFRGRVDDQVKLHGYRVEPAEVEAVLRQIPSVDRAAVQVVDGRLVAWVQSSSADRPTLRTHLRTLLPDYLIPGRLEIVTGLPLTAAGKIDRAALSALSPKPAPSPKSALSTQVEPATATEQLLADLWKRQLEVEQVSRGDDFFALGGDSIGVLELFASLAEHRTALPRPTVLYRNRTLAELATAIDTFTAEAVSGGDSGGEVEGGVASGEYPVSLTQRGFLLADAVGAPSTWLAAPRLSGPLELERFQRAVDVLVERHAMLRTVFPRDARPPVQREIAAARLTVGYLETPRPLDEELSAEREHRFDSAEWPLVRLRLLRYGPSDHVLVVHAHHLVGDGYSVALLMRELLAVYDGETLPVLRSTFRDYVSLLATIRPEVAPHDGGPLVTGGEIATAGVTVTERNVAALRKLAVDAGVTPFVPVLAAYRQALVQVIGRPDPVIGVAVTGRDHALTDMTRIFGPCATAVAVQVKEATARRTTDAEVVGAEIAVAEVAGGECVRGVGLAEVAAAVDEARNRSFTAPQGWQYFFTHLEFGAPAPGRTLSLAWDDMDAELAVPPGTEVLLAVRPVAGGGLRLTLRGRLAKETLDRLAIAINNDMNRRIGQGKGVGARAGRGTALDSDAALDSALVGYLPAPAHWGALAGGLPVEIRAMLVGLDRESLRAAIFPDGGARLLETVETPLGRSGFVAVPRFADELGHTGLAEVAAGGVDLAAGLGARTVSLAGMIPALTGYGAALTPYRRKEVDLTTGHAVTAASVVRTTFAALAAQGRELRDCVVAVLGVGSIGDSSLSLLLARAPEPPAGLILCDLPSAAGRLKDLAATLDMPVETATDGPAAVYRADVIVAATSGGPNTLDVDRLKPGTILIDDSFPHCFDTGRALTRMRERGDVLIVGGGLLDCGDTRRIPAEGLPAVNAQLPGSIASCQLESLLHATMPGLPLVTGPVDAERAAAYWDALEAADIAAAPLHLLNQLRGDH